MLNQYQLQSKVNLNQPPHTHNAQITNLVHIIIAHILGLSNPTSSEVSTLNTNKTL